MIWKDVDDRHYPHSVPFCSLCAFPAYRLLRLITFHLFLLVVSAAVLFLELALVAALGGDEKNFHHPPHHSLQSSVCTAIVFQKRE